MPVLATLFFISYVKLLCAILVVLECTIVEYLDGQRWVWSLDGSVLYFSLEHSILFAVAIYAFPGDVMDAIHIHIALHSVSKKTLKSLYFALGE